MSGQLLLFGGPGPRYPVHAPGDCGGAVVPFDHSAPRGITHYCSSCGAELGDDALMLARARRAQKAAGLEPERYTTYLAAGLARLRVARREAVRIRESEAGDGAPLLVRAG